MSEQMPRIKSIAGLSDAEALKKLDELELRARAARHGQYARQGRVMLRRVLRAREILRERLKERKHDRDVLHRAHTVGGRETAFGGVLGAS